jgi:hypothetical protein
MKKLVLGALIAATSFTGCTSDSGPDDPVDTDSVVKVNWEFTHLATNAARSCPTDFTTATVVSQSIDPVTHLGTGLKVKDKFDCSAGTGSLTLPPDTYLIWVEITKANGDTGSNFYAQSEEFFVDTTLGDASFDTEILDDGGYFFLEWDLADAVTLQPLSCSAAGVASHGIRTIASTPASSVDLEDTFPCTDHFGTTDGLVAGNYMITVQAESAGGTILGEPQTISDTIEAPNKLTDLGLFVLPID